MKKAIIIILVAVLLLAVLFVPIPGGIYKDGGTQEYQALTYKSVHWKRLHADGVYEKNCIYWFPENFKSIDELWEKELASVTQSFLAKILELTETTALVEPVEGEAVRSSSDRISICTENLPNNGIEVGGYVQVYYTGSIKETYPAQIDVTTWEATRDLRKLNYTGTWLHKENAEKYENSVLENIVITEIYGDCFLAVYAWPSPYQLKLNGVLGEAWCVGDQVTCTVENGYADNEKHLFEADFLSVEESDWQPDPYACYKPVIYLYPEAETEVAVKLALQGELTCTYPAYHDGWQVTAAPDGTLTDAKGQTYNYLYWEGETNAQWDMTEGFCIKGEDTAAFLEDALAKLGLNRKEANEFIVYWLPVMEQNPYNLISFQTAAYENAAALHVAPAPDTVIRVFMTFKGMDAYLDIPAQTLGAPERKGFTVIEWGGTELK